MIGGIVLAAGASSRMGRNKAELPARPDGRTFVDTIEETLAAAGVVTFANPISVASGNTGTATITNLIVSGSGAVFSGAVTLNNHDLTVVTANNSTLTVSGTIGGTGNVLFQKVGTGTLTAGGANYFVGAVASPAGGVLRSLVACFASALPSERVFVGWGHRGAGGVAIAVRPARGAAGRGRRRSAQSSAPSIDGSGVRGWVSRSAASISLAANTMRISVGSSPGRARSAVIRAFASR